MGSFRSAADRLYRRLLALYPGEFRSEFGEEMTLLFRDRSRHERLLPLLIEVLADAARTAPKEHLAMWSQDLRYALRTMRRNPGFTLVAAGSLAVGIGANAAMFSLADALLLRPLAVSRPDEVVSLRNTAESGSFGAAYSSVSHPDYLDLRRDARSVDGLAAYGFFSAAVAPTGVAVPQVTMGMFVSGNLFALMGVEPALGRAFLPDEDQVPGRNPVVVLSHLAWKTTLGGDPDVVGKTIRVNRVVLTIVGIAPERFTGMHQMLRPAVFVPLAMAPALLGPDGDRMLTARDARGLSVKGRLAKGATVAQADAELAMLARSLEQAYPKTNRGQGLAVRTELQARIDGSPPDAALMTMLMTLVALVLLIACANVASLLVGRSASRAREIAVRLAVGSGTARLVRQLLTESLLLGLLGGVLGLGLALAGIAFFQRIPLPADVPVVLAVRLDGRVLLFTLLASLASVLLCGLVPALRAARTDVVSGLKSGGPGVVGRLPMRGRHALVVAQVALSVVLLVAASAVTRGFERTLRADAGFRIDSLLLTSFDPSVTRRTPEQIRAFYRELVDRARLLPGVRSAALTYAVPFGFDLQQFNYLPEGATPPPGKETLSSLASTVDPAYFETFGVGIVQGRAFAETDVEGAPRVVIVNEEVARRHWPGQQATGKRLRLEGPSGPWAEVVGVARTHKYIWIGEAPGEFLYVPLRQSDRQRMTLVLRSEGDPMSLAAPVRALAASVSPDVPIQSMRTMKDWFDTRAVTVPRMLGQTVASMGMMGLALALVGLYALMAYSVSRRTREIGLRMAVGADRGRVLRMVLGQGLALALVGIVCGLAASVVTSRLLASVVAGVHANDPVPLVAVPLAILGVTLFAALVPARRAARIDPLVALRQD